MQEIARFIVEEWDSAGYQEQPARYSGCRSHVKP
jgi:hypothetical protein